MDTYSRDVRDVGGTQNNPRRDTNRFSDMGVEVNFESPPTAVYSRLEVSPRNSTLLGKTGNAKKKDLDRRTLLLPTSRSSVEQ